MPEAASKLRVAVLGSGNIGTDLLVKILRSPVLECVLFLGRRLASPGMAKASSLGVRVSDRGIDALVRDPDCFNLVFDATSAESHQRHWPILDALGKRVINLTPARIGDLCVPAVNLNECMQSRNLNMISCGGQVGIPLAFAMAQVHAGIDYVEVVSTIASRSAGPATRLNMDEYVANTEQGLLRFSGCRRAKAILNLNPADPPIMMQTTVFAKLTDPDIERIRTEVDRMANAIQSYVPGFRLLMPPVAEDGRVAAMVSVQGRGDYLQKYAGNLDIINCAAIAAAEACARHAYADKGS